MENEFLKALQKFSNRTYTENGDLAVKSTLNYNLDFFGTASSKRGRREFVKEMFELAYKEDRILTLKNILYLRDIENGNGERDLFRACLEVLVDLDEEDAFLYLVDAIQEIGRWDDIIHIICYKEDSRIAFDLAYIVAIQINKDYGSEHPSLLGKWLPSINASSKETRRKARIMAKFLKDGNQAEYRKMCTYLRKKINIIETKITNKDYSFDYNKVPARALSKYTSAFMRNDEKRYLDYIESLQNGENTDKLAQRVKKYFPYEIYGKVSDSKQEAIMEQLWKALPKEMTNKKMLVVRDGSGSMLTTIGNSNTTALDIASSLTLYSSERLTGDFKNAFITFSAYPEFVKIPENVDTLKEKKMFLDEFGDCSTTNIMATYDLILDACIKSKEEDRPDSIVIISDMQFDSIFDDYEADKISTFDKIKSKFEKAGIKIPTLIYWNVYTRDDKVIFPTSCIENVILISGFSGNVFNDIAKNGAVDALDFMLKTLEKYDKYFIEEE